MANLTYTGKETAKQLMKPEQVTEIIKMLSQDSQVLARMRRLPNMTSKQTRMPVLDLLPQAYWVDGEAGLKQTTKAGWKGKIINAEELAVIVPVPDEIIADADYPIVQEIIPLVIAAFKEKIDKAVLFGIDKPALWPEGLMTLARNNGHIVSLGSGNTDMYDKVLGIDGLLYQIENDGFEPNGVLGNVRAKARIRSLTDKEGRKITMGSNEVDSLPVSYVTNGAWTDPKALLLAGDFTKTVYAIRSDIEFQKFTEGVISDEEGRIVYNLMQQDMTAFRFTMRLGWQIANPVTQMNENGETRFPLSVLTEADPTPLTTVTFTVASGASGTPAVKDAIVDFGGVERKTNTSGKAVFHVPADAKGSYYVTKGDQTIRGEIKKASSETAVAVNNFPVKA